MFGWIVNMLEVLSMPGFWTYQGSEYTGVTQTSECALISLHHSWICLFMSDYARMLNTNSILLWPVSLISELAIFEKKVQKRICIIFVKFSIADVWEGCEYTWSPENTRVLNMALVPNMSAFWIHQNSEYTGVTEASECAWISLDNSWICLIISEYVRICLNIPTYASIWLNLYEWILSCMPPL